MDSLRCVVERITFQNDDNGYTVLRVKSNVNRAAAPPLTPVTSCRKLPLSDHNDKCLNVLYHYRSKYEWN